MNRDTGRFSTLLVAGLVVLATAPAPAFGSAPTPVPDASSSHQGVPSTVSPDQSSERTRSLSSPSVGSVTECTTIDSAGRYVLTDNVTRNDRPEDQPTCITITASDVILDGEGFEMEGNVSTDESENAVTGGVAILATDASNITIQDVRLRAWKHGVRFENVTDGTVRIAGFEYAGVSAVDSADVTVHDSVLRGATVDLKADGAVVRGSSINADPTGEAVRSGIRIRGTDGSVVNSFVNSPPETGSFEPSGIVLVGNDHAVRDALVVGALPTRRDPDPRAEGRGFNISGNSNVLTNVTLNLTRSSSLRGDSNRIEKLGVKDGNGAVFTGDNNVLANSSFVDSDINVEGSGNVVTNISTNQYADIRGPNTTLSDSQIDEAIVAGKDVSSFRNDVGFLRVINSRRLLLVNNTAEFVNIDDSRRAVIRNNEVRDINVAGTDESTIRRNKDVQNLELFFSNDNTIYDQTADSILVRNSKSNSLRSVKGGEIRLEGARHHSLTNVTATEIRLKRSGNKGSFNNSLSGSTATEIHLEDTQFSSVSRTTADRISFEEISDNNTVDRSTVGLIEVVDDSRNNTFRNNTASFRIAGETSFDNRLVGNTVTDSDVGIEIDRARRTVVRNNTVRNTTRGIVLEGATDNRLLNNTVVRTDGPAFRSRKGSVNNTVRNLTLGPTVSFRSRDIELDAEPSPPDPPAGRSDVGVFLDAANTSADSWLALTVHYTAANATGVDEETLRLWRYRGSWAEVPGFNRVDPDGNTVTANVSGDSFGVLAPLGNATGTTAPTISDYDARTPGDGTLAVQFDSSEQLSDVLVVVTNASGTEVARLTEGDFTVSGAGPYTYTGSVALPNGTYTATLETAADADGNDGATGQSATVTIGRANVQLSLAANRTAVDPGESVNFTVTRTDTGERVNATLRTDDRSVVTGADGQVNVSFAEAGTVGVTATKADTASEAFRNDTVEIVVRSEAPEPSRIAVEPQTDPVAAGESFRVAVTYNATAADVYGVQFALAYNASLLTATNVTKGPYLGPEADTLVLNSSTDDAVGRVRYGETRRTDGGVSGNGTVAFVAFTVTEQLEAPETRTNVSLVAVEVSDPDGRAIATDRENGSLRLERNRPPTLSASLAFDGNNVGSPVVLNVSATDDTRVQAVRLLDPTGSEVDTLPCEVDECTGTLSDTPTTASWNGTTGAYDTVAYRVVATDDEGATTTATVRTEVFIAGDGTGDGVVDIADAVAIGRSWTCTATESCYAATGDLNNDGVVNIFDAVVLGRNWQATAGD